MVVFDVHCDILSKIKSPEELFNNRYKWDVERARQFGTFIQVFATFADHEYRQNPAYVMQCQFERGIEAEMLHPEALTLIRSKDSLKSLKPNHVYGLMAAEGAEIFSGSLEELERLYARGLRLVTLCWNYDNEVCDSVAGNSTHQGLSDFGRAVIEKMRQLGMIIDVSHASDQTLEDVLAMKGTVIASHSNCRALCNHKRNLTDRQIVQIAKSGGVIGIAMVPIFITESGAADMKDVVRHIEHMASLVGTGSIGLGCDLEGYPRLPLGFDGVESLHTLWDELDKLNYSDEAIRGIQYANFLNVFYKALR